MNATAQDIDENDLGDPTTDRMEAAQEQAQDLAPADESQPPIGTIEDTSLAAAQGPEASLRQAADSAEAAGKPLLVKVGLHLYDTKRQNYIGWKGQSWKASLANAEAARVFRNALAVFFEALSLVGPARLIAVLRREIDGQRGTTAA